MGIRKSLRNHSDPARYTTDNFGADIYIESGSHYDDEVEICIESQRFEAEDLEQAAALFLATAKRLREGKKG